MAEIFIKKYMEHAQAESNPIKPITDDNINFELSKEFLIELKNNAYHGEEKITTWEEIVEKFFCKFYTESHDGEDEMLDEGDNWEIDPLEFISRVNSSFENHMKLDGRTKKLLSNLKKGRDLSAPFDKKRLRAAIFLLRLYTSLVARHQCGLTEDANQKVSLGLYLPSWSQCLKAGYYLWDEEFEDIGEQNKEKGRADMFHVGLSFIKMKRDGLLPGDGNVDPPANFTNEDGDKGITTTIDRKVKVFVSKASIRRYLKLEDSEGLKTLPTAEIFEQLALMSNMKRASKGYSGVDIPLFPTMLTTPESTPSRITSSPSLSPQTHSSTSQPPSTPPFIQPTPVTEEAAPMPHESPLQSVHSLGHDEGSLSLNELMDLCISLSKKVESLESKLKQTKQTYNAALTKLIKRVKKLEQTIKTSQARWRAKVVISDDEKVEEDPSNQGRSLIEELDLDARISLVPPHAEDQGRFDETQISDQPEEQLGVFNAATVLTDAARRRISVENVQTYIKRRREVSTGSGGVSTASRLVSTADISTASEFYSTAGVKAKYKGKAIMHEFEPPKKIKKREARFKAEKEQERIDFETALELQKQLDEREEVETKVDEAHDIDWSDPVVLRYHTLQNRPFSMAEVRNNMCLYLKNQGGYKMSHFKGMSYEDIRPIFERVWDKNQAFIPIGSEIEKERLEGEEQKSNLLGQRAREILVKKKKVLMVESLAPKYTIVDVEKTDSSDAEERREERNRF
ncbi:hypothetical protein Tco_0404869 [Tanacetum coccineum]